MDMIDEEINRLKIRLEELKGRIIPDYENRTQMLYGQIIQLPKDHPDRIKFEHEYTLLSKELSMRSDEMISTRQQMENLEMEKNFRR